MPSSRLLPIVMFLGAGACAESGGGALLPVPMDVTAPYGFVAGSPAAFRTPTGTRFHGSVCRHSWMAPPRRVHLDQISAAGAIMASTSRPLFGLEGRNSSCTFYDVATDWMIAPGERVSVCAARTDRPCARQK